MPLTVTRIKTRETLAGLELAGADTARKCLGGTQVTRLERSGVGVGKGP